MVPGVAVGAAGACFGVLLFFGEGSVGGGERGMSGGDFRGSGGDRRGGGGLRGEGGGEGGRKRKVGSRYWLQVASMRAAWPLVNSFMHASVL